MKKIILSIAIVLTLNSCTTPEQPTTENNQTIPQTTFNIPTGARGNYCIMGYDNLTNPIPLQSYAKVEANKITVYEDDGTTEKEVITEGVVNYITTINNTTFSRLEVLKNGVLIFKIQWNGNGGNRYDINHRTTASKLTMKRFN